MNTIIGFPKPQVACSIHAGGTVRFMPGAPMNDRLMQS